jgi:hypothetical protein
MIGEQVRDLRRARRPFRLAQSDVLRLDGARAVVIVAPLAPQEHEREGENDFDK